MKEKVLSINVKGMRAGNVARILGTIEETYNQPTVDQTTDGLTVYIESWRDTK